MQLDDQKHLLTDIVTPFAAVRLDAQLKHYQKQQKREKETLMQRQEMNIWLNTKLQQKQERKGQKQLTYLLINSSLIQLYLQIMAPIT